ncbi:MAG: MarR family transcriptional regulator [Thermoleophilaceae bacterium]|nr:MarR family transcriptional regulator [Thermoleophilaceae bacterium]
MATHAAKRDAGQEAWALLGALTLGQRNRFMAAVAEFDLSPMQAHALKMLDPEHPLPMSDLAGQLRCDASNVTGIVDRLENRGLVERRPDPADRRVKALALTTEGLALRKLVVDRLAEPPEAIKRLSAEDQRTLRDILTRALDA